MPVSFNELLLCHWEHLACWLVLHIFQYVDTNIADIPQGIGKQTGFESPLPSRPVLKLQLEQMPAVKSTISTT